MAGRKKGGCFLFLLVGITVFFGLLLAGCAKESAQTGLPGSQSSTGGQGYPSTSTTPPGSQSSTGGQGYPSTSTTQQVSQGSTFAKTIGGSSDDFANSIIQSSDGGYVVAGGTYSFGAGKADIYVVKLDSSGNVIWTKTIGGSSDDAAYSIIQSSDGGYVLAGWTLSFGAGSYDIYVVKLDSSGNVLWTKTIGGSSDDRAYSIIQSSDGGYVLAGYTWSFGAGSYDIYVVKLDSSGNVLWTKTIGGSSAAEVANSIIQSSDGGYVVAGYTESSLASVDIYVVKLDSSGNVLWTKTIGGSDHDFAYSIIQSSDGGYVVAGSYGDIYVVKLDSSGNVIWTKTIGGSSSDGAYSIIQSSDGGYVVAGYTESFGAAYGDIYVVKLDSSGNVIWTKTIGGSDTDTANSIIQSSDGGYVVAGATRTFKAGRGRDADIYVVKMDANGNVCFSQNITNYSVSSTIPSFSSPSVVAISQSPTVNTVSPTVASYASSVSDVCALAKAPHLCSESQDCGFGPAIASGEKEDVKSYGCSAGGVLSRFLIPASMLIIYGWLRKKRKKKKGF
jgi:arginine repressor